MKLFCLSLFLQRKAFAFQSNSCLKAVGQILKMLTFDLLPSDCALDVIKYLNIREKVIYCSINSTWNTLLNDSFRSQKILVFSRNEYVQSSCPDVSHNWSSADIVATNSIRYEGNCEDSWRIELIKRCPKSESSNCTLGRLGRPSTFVTWFNFGYVLSTLGARRCGGQQL